MRKLILSLMIAAASAVPVLRALAADPVSVPSDTVALGPQELMQKVAQDLLDDLNANREALSKDPSGLRALVDKHLLPHFDTDYAARLVLGKHWKDANPEQRQRFVDAFYKSLLENYGAALTEFTADRMRVLPFQGDAAADRATVRTEVKRSDGTRVPVNYSMRKTDDGWKAWDVTIEGISYVKNFRTQYGAEIDEKGLEVVIRRLETEGVKPAPKKSA